jgi:RNA polymerase sigma factor (sigma-70 family)
VNDDVSAGSRDSLWLAQTFDDHAMHVRRFFVRRLQGRDSVIDADDLTAEVFAVAWRRRDDVPHDATLPWLYGVARRVLGSHLRGNSRVIAATDEDLDDVLDEYSDPAELVTEDLHLREAWQQLSARDRQVLALVAWEGLSEAGVADVLGITLGGASSAISRARQRFSDSLARSR